jgi:hypothetical protein
MGLFLIAALRSYTVYRTLITAQKSPLGELVFFYVAVLLILIGLVKVF